MAVLIDASILIEVERGRLELEPHVVQRQDEEFFLSVITASELSWSASGGTGGGPDQACSVCRRHPRALSSAASGSGDGPGPCTGVGRTHGRG